MHFQSLTNNPQFINNLIFYRKQIKIKVIEILFFNYEQFMNRVDLYISKF